MSGQLRVDEITDEAGTGSPSFPQGIAPSSLGTGTPDATNFLRGDGSWQPVDVEGEIADFAAGEPGQPRLVGNAVSIFPGTYPVLTVTASDASSIANGIDVLRGTINFNTFAGPPKDGAELRIVKYTGSVRVRAVFRTFASGGTYNASVLKNGVEVQTFTGTGPNTLSADISVVPNDVILWKVNSFSTGDPADFNFFDMGSNTASNGYVARLLFAPAV
jgi:hypothetical protein